MGVSGVGGRVRCRWACLSELNKSCYHVIYVTNPKSTLYSSDS